MTTIIILRLIAMLFSLATALLCAYLSYSYYVKRKNKPLNYSFYTNIFGASVYFLCFVVNLIHCLSKGN